MLGIIFSLLATLATLVFAFSLDARRERDDYEKRIVVPQSSSQISIPHDPNTQAHS
jgi:hypothetical protein